MRGLSTSTITAGGVDAQAEAGGRRGFTPRRQDAKKGLNAVAAGRLDSGFLGFDWVRRKNVSAGNGGLLGFDGQFRGTYAAGRSGRR